MTISDPRLIVLMDLLWQQFERAQGNERQTLNVISEVRKALGITGGDLVAEMEAKGYIQKSEPKTDPEPGPMERLPLRDALADVNVELLEAHPTTGMLLRCIFCGSLWRPAGYQGGDLLRPAKGFHRCPQGCNASATFKWDEGEAPTFNAMSDYR